MFGNPDRRIRVILFSFIILFALVAARAVFLQTVSADVLAEMAAEQHVQQVDLPARRGTIFDRNGTELAVGQEMKTIFANPQQIDDPLAAAAQLAPLLKVDQAELLEKLSNRESGFEYLARKVQPEVAAEVEALKIPSVGFLSEEQRVYPQGHLAAQVIGFAGTDNTGLAGMELQLDGALMGTGGRQRVVTDAGGNQIEMLSLEEGARGKDVYLTIDNPIQYEAEKVLAETVKKTGAKGAMAIVMDPRSGEIYAMANVPTANANNFDSTPDELRRNRTVTDTYEPGSVFKAVTAAAGLEDGAVAPGQTFYLPPALELGGYTIEDAYQRGAVDWDLGQIIEHSSNIGTVTVAMRVGAGRLNYWIHQFGFGRTTGIDFPGEVVGIVEPPETWSESSIGNIPIGQGISVTPIQMASAYAAIANGGVAVTPHLVKSVDGEPAELEPGTRVISEATAEHLAHYLGRVVDGEGAPLARVEGYSVAGKTGTAQKPTPDGGYTDGIYIGTFVGYVPAGSPELLVMVVVDEPGEGGGGATVAAPAFQRITEFSLRRLKISP
ncbi:MAG: penicillin-binding protein 2 [Gaiellales bacterium]|nr:MAG: penicillin-binding protein 2 [Gaiellales bacterium]